MHIGNELLTPGAGLALIGISGAGLSYAVWRARKVLDERKVPLMGVMGAFVFAGQMINFPIMVGTSGHLGGGMLLAILLGPDIAALTMASILIIQCLIFQDGGLFALGANIINMALVPSYIGWNIFKAISSLSSGTRMYYSAIFISSLLSVTIGALLVPLEVALSGIQLIPLQTFMVMMGGVHIIIGIVEGFITIAVIGFIYQVRPDVVSWTDHHKPVFSFRGVTLIFLLLTLLLSGYVSYYASHYPDGLEWVQEKLGIVPTEGVQVALDKPVDTSPLKSPLQDYQIPSEKLQAQYPHVSKGMAGAIGSIITLGMLFGVGAVLRRRRNEPHDY